MSLTTHPAFVLDRSERLLLTLRFGGFTVAEIAALGTDPREIRRSEALAMQKLRNGGMSDDAIRAYFVRSLGERGCRRCGSSMHRSGACWRWDHWAPRVNG